MDGREIADTAIKQTIGWVRRELGPTASGVTARAGHAFSVAPIDIYLVEDAWMAGSPATTARAESGVVGYVPFTDFNWLTTSDRARNGHVNASYEFDIDAAPPIIKSRRALRRQVCRADRHQHQQACRRCQCERVLRRDAVKPGVDQARSRVGEHSSQFETDAEKAQRFAGEVFVRAKPRLAVYSHICMPAATDEELLQPTRKTYAGPLELDKD